MLQIPEHLRPRKLLVKNIRNSLRSFATKIEKLQFGHPVFELSSCTDTKETISNTLQLANNS